MKSCNNTAPVVPISLVACDVLCYRWGPPEAVRTQRRVASLPLLFFLSLSYPLSLSLLLSSVPSPTAALFFLLTLSLYLSLTFCLTLSLSSHPLCSSSSSTLTIAPSLPQGFSCQSAVSQINPINMHINTLIYTCVYICTNRFISCMTKQLHIHGPYQSIHPPSSTFVIASAAGIAAVCIRPLWLNWYTVC